jgi:hypothetical protein
MKISGSQIRPQIRPQILGLPDAHEFPQSFERQLWVNDAALASEEAALARGGPERSRAPSRRERDQ